MAGGLAFSALIVALVAFLVWQYVASRNALSTTRVESVLPPGHAAQLIAGAFDGVRSALWTPGAGPGVINMRRRGKDGGIVMSIDITPLPNGGSAVDMWASHYNEYFIVFANFAGSVNSRKKAIARLLDGGAPATGSSHPSPGQYA